MARPAVEIIGIEQLNEVLNELPLKLSKKMLNTTARRVIKRVHDSAVSNLSQHSKTLPDQVKIWPLKSWRAGYWTGWNLKQAKEAYGKAKTRAEKAWAFRGAFWLEYGTSGVGRAKRYHGKSYRKIEPTGWFRRAVDSNIDGVKKDFAGEVANTINRFLNRKIKHYGGW
jgi:hypothetical protein